MERNITELISQMTLEEKAGLVSGKDYWYTKEVERLTFVEVSYAQGYRLSEERTDEEFPDGTELGAD